MNLLSETYGISNKLVRFVAQGSYVLVLTGVPLVPVAYRSPILIDAFFARPTAF